MQSPGEPCGSGLTAQAAQELGLAPGTAVGTSLIDAHAGGLGEYSLYLAITQLTAISCCPFCFWGRVGF